MRDRPNTIFILFLLFLFSGFHYLVRTSFTAPFGACCRDEILLNNKARWDQHFDDNGLRLKQKILPNKSMELFAKLRFGPLINNKKFGDHHSGMHPPQLRIVILIGVHLVHGVTSYLEVDEEKLRKWALYGIAPTDQKEKFKNPSKDQKNDKSNDVIKEDQYEESSKYTYKLGDLSNSISKNANERNSSSGDLPSDPSKKEDNSVFKDYHVSLNSTTKDGESNVLRNNHSEEFQKNYMKEKHEEATNSISENDPEVLPKNPDNESEVSNVIPGDDDNADYDYEKEKDYWNEWAKNYSETDAGWGTGGYGLHLSLLGPAVILRQRWPWNRRGQRRRNRFRDELK